jgi:hypothetical protein
MQSASTSRDEAANNTCFQTGVIRVQVNFYEPEFAGKYSLKMMIDSPAMDSRRFTVALSFPGEKREFVSKVADLLAKRFGQQKVLYDKYHEAEFARPNLDVHLPNLYGTQSELIAIFLCDEYKKKRWCNLEWRSIRQLIATADEDRIMFLSFDNIGAIPEIGIYDGDGYVSIGDRSPEQIAELILNRYTPPREERNSPPTTLFDISRIVKYAPAELIGREAELRLLNEAWAKAVSNSGERPRVLTFVALGGEGKTSLVAKWAADLAFRNWPGCDAVFAWSFYSQGTREQMAASSDLFLKEALTFFGDDKDKEFAASPAGAFEKGQRLARIVGERHSLLILDGLEPLQYSTEAKAFKPGELKDQGVAKLLKDLASSSHGLCIVTTRIEVPDLQVFKGGAVIETHLKRLPRAAGVILLKSLGVKGSERRNLPLKGGDEKSEKLNEFEKLVEDVKGHALTLTLFGGFLKRAFHGDIRQRDRVKFEKADEKIDGGHAFRTMAAYERWLLRDGGDEGRREVAVLRLMGLFDRPADAGCLGALRSETIPNLNEPLAALADDDWGFCLSGLETAKLLTVNRDASDELVSLDAHPHLREYFARQLCTQQPDAWRGAHRLLYEHLCKHNEGDKPTLEDLQPLYQAVAHGCHAGLQQEACEKVYSARISKGNKHYSAKKLGAFGSDLGAAACFFEQPWSHLSHALSEIWQSWLMSQTAELLKAFGRLSEAFQPTRAGIEMAINAAEFASDEQTRIYQFRQVAIRAGNLSELELTLGDVAQAVGDGEQSVTYGDRSSDPFWISASRTTHADALHQAGHRGKAETRFREAEQMQVKHQPYYPLLYSLWGFRYCDLILAFPEHAAWRICLESPLKAEEWAEPAGNGTPTEICRDVSRRATQTLKWVSDYGGDVLSPSLDHLTLGRAALHAAILEPSAIRNSQSDIEEAVVGLRRSGNKDYLPRGLLTRAWLRFLTGARIGPASAQEDLDEAWEIAERGPMRLHMADIHLYRARLFHEVKPYPWNKNTDGTGRGPKDDLAAARKLIEQCGYWRRKEELEDAEEAAKGWD